MAQVDRPADDDPIYIQITNQETLDDLRALAFEEAIKKYPAPTAKDQFDMKGSIGYGRRFLYNEFPEYSTSKKREFKKLKSLLIQEVTWSLNSTINITVYYKRDSLIWKPFLSEVWKFGTLY